MSIGVSQLNKKNTIGVFMVLTLGKVWSGVEREHELASY